MPKGDPKEAMLQAVLDNDLHAQWTILGASRPPLPPSPPGATSDGMDPWQSSVEKRLDSLDSRSQRTEQAVSDIRVDVGVLRERVGHLPTKSWMVTGLSTALVIIAALITFAEKLHALVS